jgi:hypothetical protein
MAYYNGFPATYQNPYYQQQVIPQQPVVQQPQQQQNTGIIWIQGIEGAKSYLVAPNTTVQLWDSEAQVIYLKSADASGMPSMKIIDYTIRGAEMPNNGFSFDEHKFISRDEFNGLKSEFEALKSKLDELKPSQSTLTQS